MPDRVERWTFIAGLVVFLAGQIGINAFGAMTKDEIAVDVIHWLMLIGVVLMIPFAANLPRKGLAMILSPLLLLGIVGVIGMCVIDFVLWSLPEPQFRGDVARALIDTGAVWQPFMRWGPGEVFVTGLALPSLLYVRESRWGSVLVAVGAFTMAAGTAWFNPIGYCFMIVGYVLNFRVLHPDPEGDLQNV